MLAQGNWRPSTSHGRSPTGEEQVVRTPFSSESITGMFIELAFIYKHSVSLVVLWVLCYAVILNGYLNL